MDALCPNYYCSQRLQQKPASLCASCKTPLIIGNKNKYRLTGAIRTSPNKIDSSEYCWYELLQAKEEKDGKDVIVKMLVITPESSAVPSSAEDIRNIKRRFQREYELLRKGLPGICRAYEILDVPLTLKDGCVRMEAIVMEKIAGDNLEEYVEKYGAINSQQAFRWLQQLVKTIGIMHNQQIQHRDIKPSNIMISGVAPNEKLTLIDFGIAVDKLSSDKTAVLGTDGYVAPEYLAEGLDRKYRNEYDFYSLGRTFRRLLTPKDWFLATPLDPKLQEIIQRMIGEPSKRFQSAEEILRCLKDRNKPSWLQPAEIRKILKVKLLPIYFLCALGIIYLMQRLPDVAINMDYGSDSSSALLVSGGRSLFNKPSSQIKKDAFSAFSQKDWQLAARKFGESLAKEKQQDPETVIFQQNALIAQQDSVSIVAVVPISSNPNVAEEILRGIAMKQIEVNKDENNYIGGRKLKVYIADDANDPMKSVPIAKEVITTRDIIAVVGSNATTPSGAAALIYQKASLVMISPTAFDKSLKDRGEYIFRIIPTTKYVAKKFGDYTINVIHPKKMLFCVDSESKDNLAFSEDYESYLLSNDVKIDKSCKLKPGKTDVKNQLEQSIKNGADSILIAPHVDRIHYLDGLIEVNNAQAKKLFLFASPTVYTREALEKEVDGMVFPAWWSPEMEDAKTFAEKMKNFWHGEVNWRSATTYDATSAIASAGKTCVRQSISLARVCLMKNLRADDFVAPGSIGVVKFDKDIDRKMDIVILKADKTKKGFAPKILYPKKSDENIPNKK
jgi:branched-chain amino acid transport system substrate-binding protein